MRPSKGQIRRNANITFHSQKAGFVNMARVSYVVASRGVAPLQHM